MSKNSRRVVYGETLRSGMLEGVNILNKAVKSTLGPRGRNVALDRQLPLITKDGATVAREVDLGYGPAAIGAKVVKEAATRTATSAGDGTTTSTVLASALFNNLQKATATGSNPVFLARGVMKGSQDAVGLIQNLARKVTTTEDITHVATLCSNGDTQLGELIAEAMEASGKDGIISVVEGKGLTTTLEFSEGYQLDRGYHTPEYLPLFDPDGSFKNKISLQDAHVLVANKIMSNIQEFLPLLEYMLSSGKPVVMFAHDFSGDFLTTVNYNALQLQKIKPLMIKMPRFAEKRTWLLGDIACLTGAIMIDDEQGIKAAKMAPEDYLGTCDSVEVTPTSTVLIGGSGSDEEIYTRLQQIRALAARASSEHDKEYHEERASSLSGGLTLIKIGGASDLSVKEYRARVEDALSATKAAIEYGIVPGGSSTLVYISENLKNPYEPGTEEFIGYDLFAKSLVEPFLALVSNAGLKAEYMLGTLIERKLTKPNAALNVRTNQWIDDSFEEGLVDPAKVLIEAILHSSSAASLLNSSEAAILLNNQD